MARPKRSSYPVTLDEWAVYGIGEPDENGIYPEYATPPVQRDKTEQDGVRVSWVEIFSHWDEIIVPDLYAVYGTAVDTIDSWPVFRRMILGLLGRTGSMFSRIKIREMEAKQDKAHAHSSG